MNPFSKYSLDKLVNMVDKAFSLVEDPCDLARYYREKLNETVNCEYLDYHFPKFWAVQTLEALVVQVWRETFEEVRKSKGDRKAENAAFEKCEEFVNRFRG